MQVKNTNLEEIKAALEKVNEKYEGNIRFHYEGITSKNAKGTHLQFKLYTHSVEKPGHRRGQCGFYEGTSKRLRYACWHVHGDFFDALLDINPNLEIKVGRDIRVYQSVTGRHGNWQDFNIGSQYQPINFSQACDC